MLTFVLVGAKLTQQLLEGRVPLLEKPALPARAPGAGAGALAARPVAARAGAQTFAGRSARFIRIGTIAGAGPSRPAVGPARRAGRGSLAGDARSCRDLALAGGGGRCAWGSSGRSTHFADRLGRLYLVWGSVVAAFVLNAALAWCRSWARPRGCTAFSSRGRPRSGPPRRTTCSRPPATAVLRRLGPPVRRDGRRTPAFERIALVPNGRSCSGP